MLYIIERAQREFFLKIHKNFLIFTEKREKG